MDVAALVIALVALAVALLALQRVRDATAQGGRERTEAQPDAERETRPPAPASARATEPGRRGVHFEFRRLDETTYLLRNYGTDPAFGVRIRADRFGRNARYREFPAGHAEEYALRPKPNPARNVVEITWYTRADKSDPIQHKRLRLEPR